MEVTIKYNERDSLGIPDTSVILEGNKVYIYKVDDKNVTNRVEVICLLYTSDAADE